MTLATTVVRTSFMTSRGLRGAPRQPLVLSAPARGWMPTGSMANNVTHQIMM